MSFRTILSVAAATLLSPGLALAAAPAPASSAAVAALVAPAPATASSSLIPIRAFARHALVSGPRLSPDGKHLAVRVDDVDGVHHSLVIYTLADMSIKSVLNLPAYVVPTDVMWASNDWLALGEGKLFGSLDQPLSTGEIIATNLDGSKQRYLYGFHNYGRRSATRQADHGFGYLVGRPDKADGHVYVRSELWDSHGRSAVYSIDAEHETRHLIADIDVPGMSFLIGPDGKASHAYGTNDDFEFVSYLRHDDRWVPLDPKVVGKRFQPIAYTADKKQVYAFWSKDGGPYKLVRAAADGSEHNVLAWHPFASVGDVQWTARPDQQPFAAAPLFGKPTEHIIQPNLRDARIYRALQKAFPDHFINFINYSDDGGMLLFGTGSDRDPGAYYLIDTTTFKVRKLFDAEPWIDPAKMAQRLPIRFEASDGTELAGFLTMPPGRAKTNLPMVLLPHGGPYSIRDSWFYDTDAQFLASRGYLVLQVNYRGSGGRGVDFIQSGYRKWGTRIQQDLIDGVKWAIDKHYADPDRICVYGASFGGYSALMSVIRAPKLFQCAIGYAGVYDLQLIYDNTEDKGATSYFETVLGRDRAELDANSPDKLAEKITVPVFLVHGKDDHTAPFNQAEAMRDALQKAHKKFEWMAVDKEGHGFYTEAHRTELMKRMLAFLGKYIGPGAPVVAQQPASPPASP